MFAAEEHHHRAVPTRALVLSLAALAVPVVGAVAFPEVLGELGALLWLLALVPAFLLAYYRGWRGVATALALGMATLSLTQVAVILLDRQVPEILLGVVVAYLGISLGIGWVTELLHRERATVEDLALTDILTRLPNRRHARMALENEFGAAERGRLLSVVLFDLDDFKAYNDRYGHAAGDQALKAFGEILTQTTRRMNLSARFGGEEFLSILSGSDTEGAMVFAERVRDALRQYRLPHGPLTVSAGVAAYHPSMRSPDELLGAADHALYRAKSEGRNCVRAFGRPVDDVPGKEEGQDEGIKKEEPEGEYPRPPDEMGRSAPPTTLLPHKITQFGQGKRVLLVEDEPPVRTLISTYLNREGFHVTEVGDVRQAVKALAREFDVVITDIRLPDSSGNELVGVVKSRWPHTQVIVITGHRDAQIAAEALNAGADRYLFKPFGMPELQSHLSDALVRRSRSLRDRAERIQLDGEAKKRAEEAREAILKGARALVKAVEVRDPYTRGHSRRVGAYSLILAEHGGFDEEELDREALRLACELHDVGKIGIPDAILNKAAPLSANEFVEVKHHPKVGRSILEPLLGDDLVLSVTQWHHERWDGTGYPDGLAGDSIPLAARLVAVADTLDAMTSTRAYRPAVPWEDAVATIEELAGAQFDPEMVATFRKALPDLDDAFREAGRNGPTEDGRGSRENEWIDEPRVGGGRWATDHDGQGTHDERGES